MPRLLTAPITGAETVLRAATALRLPNPLTVQEARSTLDSITKALDPSDASETSVQAAMPMLRSIMTWLPTGTDSVWAYIRIAEAHLMLDAVKNAGTALRLARSRASSANQVQTISSYDRRLACTP